MMDAAPENVNNSYYNHGLSHNRTGMNFLDKYGLGIDITVGVISILGAIGNGAVIWLLGFRIKRTPFMTYILNLAVADLGVLLFAVSFEFRYVSLHALIVFFYLYQLMYSASQCLLTAISIDRCVAVFFPLWHRCQRPPHLSTLVCAAIWVFSVLFTGITGTLRFVNPFLGTVKMEVYQFVANALLCLPVMSAATLALFVKVGLKAQQQRRGRLLTVILLALLFFVLFAFPLNVITILTAFTNVSIYIQFIPFPLACLNSSVNPVIYFLVGRQRKSKRRESMKMILQKVFKEEEGGEEETPV